MANPEALFGAITALMMQGDDEGVDRLVTELSGDDAKEILAFMVKLMGALFEPGGVQNAILGLKLIETDPDSMLGLYQRLAMEGE